MRSGAPGPVLGGAGKAARRSGASRRVRTPERALKRRALFSRAAGLGLRSGALGPCWFGAAEQGEERVLGPEGTSVVETEEMTSMLAYTNAHM